MLTITYEAMARPGNAANLSGNLSGILFEHPKDQPEWFASMPEPQHVDQLDTWSSLAGDNQHVIHVTGTVTYWQVDETIEQLIGQPLQEARRQLPGDYNWMIKATCTKPQRVRRSSEVFQEQLKRVLDG